MSHFLLGLENKGNLSGLRKIASCLPPEAWGFSYFVHLRKYWLKLSEWKHWQAQADNPFLIDATDNRVDALVQRLSSIPYDESLVALARSSAKSLYEDIQTDERKKRINSEVRILFSFSAYRTQF